jgi:autotransporter-associated beta strand protein
LCPKRFAHAIVASLVLLLVGAAQGQTTFDWFNTAPDGNWRQGAAGARWTGGLWDEPTFGILRFNNNNQLNMTNNVAGTYNMHGLNFGSFNTSTRTLGGNTVRLFDFSGADPHITNDSSATHIINLNLEGDGSAGDPLKINLNSSGGLTFGGTINNQGSWVDVVGSTTSAVSATFNGVISGSGGLYKNNANTTAVLAADNTYSGGTTIDAGTLQVGNGGTTGSLGTGAVTNNATLAFNRANGVNFVLSNAISGTGALQQNGGNVITISSANSYTGATTINSGTLRVTANQALGTGAAGTTVNSGGTLMLSGVNYSTAEALTINGAGVGGNGALRNNLGSSTYAGQVTAASNATINVTGAGESLTLTGGIVKNGTILTITGNGSVIVNNTGISGASSNSDLVVDGGNLIVNAASNYNGPTTVQNNGTLVANAAIDTTTLTVNAGSTLAGSASVNAGAGNVYLNGTFVAGSASGGAPREDFAITAASTIAGNSSTLTFDLFQRGGDLTGTASAADTLLVTGNLSLLSSVVLDIVNAAGLSGWAAGDKWNLWDVTGSTTGTIATVNAPSLGNPLLSWQFTESTGVLEIIAVPEPSKALFTGLGLASLLFRRRRA